MDQYLKEHLGFLSEEEHIGGDVGKKQHVISTNTIRDLTGGTYMTVCSSREQLGETWMLMDKWRKKQKLCMPSING